MMADEPTPTDNDGRKLDDTVELAPVTDNDEDLMTPSRGRVQVPRSLCHRQELGAEQRGSAHRGPRRPGQAALPPIGSPGAVR
jgi:hypothetical protein